MEHQHPSHEEQPDWLGQKKSVFPLAWPIIPLTILVSALILGASILIGSEMIAKSLSSGVVLGQSQTAAAMPAAPNSGSSAPGQASDSAVKLADRDNQPTLGNKNAKVTMVEFADFQCPFCKNFFQQTFSKIKTNYIDTGKVKYIFRYFPLTQIHVNAQISAEAAECANQQGKFWQYHDLLYSNGQSDGTNLDKASLEKYADQLGLNSGVLGFGKNKFNQCLESNATLKAVQADQAEGTKDGVNGTPTFFINGKMLVGAQPTANFEQAIEAALKQ